MIASHCTSLVHKVNCLLGLRAKPSLKLIEPVKSVHNPKYGSGAKGYANYDFEAYVQAIQEFDNEAFSLVLVDGRSRIAALQAALSKVKRGGWVMLDNSDYARYQPALAALRKLELAGWTEQPFYGPGPH